MVHGLPPKPQVNGAAGPSRPPQQAGHQARQSYQNPAPPQAQYQQAYQYPYQQQQTGGYNPYAAQAATGGYPAYAAYYQQVQAQAYPYAYGYQYQPTATPEGYSYSATYQPQSTSAPAQGQSQGYEPPNKKSRPNVAGPSVPAQAVFKPWRNCSHPGCKFLGSGEDVEIHEGDRHLIFPNGRPVERSEEEEKWASHKGPPPPIEGTGIVLQTEEDIAKWIAERKAKWPSAKRVAERDEERQAAIARGENPDRGRGRGRGGANLGKRSNPAALAEDWGRPAPEVPTGQSTRGGRQERGRGRGRGRGREDRHANTGRPIAQASSEAPVSVSEPAGNSATPQVTTIDAKVGSALVEYNSDASDGTSNSDSSDSSSSSSSDEEEVPDKPIQAQAQAQDTKSSRPICRFFAKTGRCKMGQKCRFSHDVDGKPQEAQPRPVQVQAQKPKGPKQPLKKVNPFERPSMLGALLANPIQNTLSQLTQTIRFLVANDMLQGVELNPGDAEEQEREKHRIAVVEGGVTELGSAVQVDFLAE